MQYIYVLTRSITGHNAVNVGYKFLLKHFGRHLIMYIDHIGHMIETNFNDFTSSISCLFLLLLICQGFLKQTLTVDSKNYIKCYQFVVAI